MQELEKNKEHSKEIPEPKKTDGGSGHVAELPNRLHIDGGIKMGPPPAHHMKKGTPGRR